jgi:hypothetical protein
MMLFRLWALLAALFSLGVEPGGEVDPNADVDPQGATDPGPDPDAESDPDVSDDEDDLDALMGRDPAETPEAKAAAARKRELEEVAEATARRVGGPSAPQQNAEQLQRATEDRELETLRSSGASAQQVAEKQWEINTNRTLRQSDQKSNAALFRAMELDDKNDFRELAFGTERQQKLYKIYKDRVEKRLSELRAQGTTVPRRTLMRYLIGEDQEAGNAKTKRAAKADGAAAMPANVHRIDRGRSPAAGARSDVNAKAKQSASQALRKRLENQRI